MAPTVVNLQFPRDRSFCARLKDALFPDRSTWTPVEKIEMKRIEHKSARAYIWMLGLVGCIALVVYAICVLAVLLAPVTVQGSCVMTDLHAPEVPVQIADHELHVIPRTGRCEFTVSGSQYAIRQVLP